ncbi:hypothetical protein GLAREA_05978 [Glarea lozoyensis ATCC 20868]|uniref:Uncharacterized protein n=2 Tax=Glarea lozoyensis TaxID=101852 RepID=S3DLN4_GLAL2|nr:uncharacterized protein GLAREA_05978 [Glarea lozoyensis ATCC 20868]EHK99855.1 hypothetical protein M7I_4257 [Glarea lozoyensis 74030]EPE32966.1 hypothetical protein GLAREA_05978 [Glarea lozoyensis ATCC 20868]
MVPGKKRLYMALFPSGVSNNEERKYHWAFLTGPKLEPGSQIPVPGSQYHAKNLPTGWIYEEKKLEDIRTMPNLLARIVIAKIKNEQRLNGLFRNIPIVNDNPTWRCRSWIENSLTEMIKDGQVVGTSQLNWTVIEDFAREYVRMKTDAGRYQTQQALEGPRPTWDLLESKEIVT